MLKKKHQKLCSETFKTGKPTPVLSHSKIFFIINLLQKSQTLKLCFNCKN